MSRYFVRKWTCAILFWTLSLHAGMSSEPCFGDSYDASFVADSSIHERWGRLVDTIGNVIEDLYAPLSWKEQRYHFLWCSEVQRTKKIVLARECSVKQFHFALVRLLQKLRDPHCSITFSYPHTAYVLPLSLHWVDGFLVVSRVETTFCSEIFPGMKVIAINGYKASTLFSRTKEQHFETAPYPHWADHYICEILVHKGLPWGPCYMGSRAIFRLEDVEGKQFNCDVSWLPLIDSELMFLEKNKQSNLNKFPCSSAFSCPNGFSNNPICKEPSVGSVNNFYLGAKGSSIPHLGKLVWSSRENKEAQLEAYLSAYRGIHIGYLRIPDFFSWSFSELEKHLFGMESQSDCLVIDLMNNPGGSAVMAMRLASCFFRDMISSHPERMRLSPSLFVWTSLCYDSLNNSKENALAEELADLLPILPPEDKGKSYLRKFCADISSAMFSCSGEMWPGYWMGLHKFMGTGHYSKPVYILCNEMTLSAAESFILLMRMNGEKRVVRVIGAPTGGVASAYENVSIPNIDAVKTLSYSWTLLINPITGKPIEDLGLTPDVPCHASLADFQGGFSRMRATILNAILNDVKGNR